MSETENKNLLFPGSEVACRVCGMPAGQRCKGGRPHGERVELEAHLQLKGLLEPLIRSVVEALD